MEKEFEKIVDHLIKTAISEITEKLPQVVTSIVNKRLDLIYKKLDTILDDQGDIRKDFNDFDKRLSDLQILVDTIDSRTTQMKVTQDKQPEAMSKKVEQAATDAVNSAVADSVPEAMASVVEPKRKNFQPISKRSWMDRIRRR